MRIAQRSVAAVAAVALLTAAVPATAAVGAWASGVMAKVRLIAAGVGDDGRLSAAIEIALPPGWRTYWRNPGEAGIAPIIDFSASSNLGPADVRFPVPVRVDDGYTVTNVLEGRVVVPFSAMVPVPARPVALAVSIDLGVCEVVCIPDRVEATLLVLPGHDDPAAAAVLDVAHAALPGPPEPGVFFVEGVARDGGTDERPAFRLALTAPAAAAAVMFVEGPQDWFAAAPALATADGDRASFIVIFDRTIAETPIAGARFRVTVVAGGRAIEQSLDLD